MNIERIFIGRDQLKKRLKREIFSVEAVDAAPASSRSIIGPNGIGKTRLLQELANELKESPINNVYYFETIISDSPENSQTDPYWTFWIATIKQFAGKIDISPYILNDEEYSQADSDHKFLSETAMDLKEIYDFFQDDNTMNHIDDEPGTESKALSYLNEIFDYYTDLGIRIILVIDEFDRAREMFHNGAFFQRLYDITSKAGKQWTLSVITVSRRSVSTIAHDMKQGSNLEDALPPIRIIGFNDEELEQYFALYNDIMEISEEDRRLILYFCGRTPGLLMKVLKEIYINDYRKDQIPEAIKNTILVPYDHTCRIMSTEYVDKEKNQSCMSKFMQLFIGPVYDDNLSIYLEKMASYGYITRIGEDYSSLSKTFDDEWALDEYEPIAPYFIEYVKNTVAYEDVNDLGKELNLVEKKIRQLLRNTLKNKYGNDWKEHIDQYLNSNSKDAYLDYLLKIAKNMNAAERGLEYSKLDVINFYEYYLIIRGVWSDVRTFFPDYDEQNDLKKDLSDLKKARNSFAHGTQTVLTKERMEELSQICRKILNGLDI